MKKLLVSAALLALVSGCALTINTAKDGETATQSATPNISPSVSVTLPSAGK